jgi:GNAT superfamily N-acetyltransferase
VELARPVQEGDLAVVGSLLHQAIEQAKTMRGGTVLVGPTTATQLVARWTPDTSAHLCAFLAGLIDEVVVGVAAVVVETRPAALRPTGVIECCYVEDEARGVGVGTALMQAMVAWCTAQGCADVDALALPGDRSTKQRLEAAGFTARLLTLSRRLD